MVVQNLKIIYVFSCEVRIHYKYTAIIIELLGIFVIIVVTIASWEGCTLAANWFELPQQNSKKKVLPFVPLFVVQ